MDRWRLCLGTGLLLVSTSLSAFESDVHYGLTEWLALQAGFDERAATTIATGDERSDSGDMQYIELIFAYACIGKDDLGSRHAGQYHYPSAGTVPGAPAQRAVSPGSDAAREAARAVARIPEGQANYMLLRLGEALHILQDSWSHQGVPDVAQPAPAVFTCDDTRAWGHPKARGGWNSHRADLTMHWPDDTVAMAKATYDILMQYPALTDTKRTARDWNEIRPLLDGFISASTKAEKRRWFLARGIRDVSFLEGISLTDGAEPFVLKWPGRKLPPLATPQSRQHDVEAELLEFYNRFFAQWVATNDFEALASEFGDDLGRRNAKEANRSSVAASKAELVARLKDTNIAFLPVDEFAARLDAAVEARNQLATHAIGISAAHVVTFQKNLVAATDAHQSVTKTVEASSVVTGAEEGKYAQAEYSRVKNTRHPIGQRLHNFRLQILDFRLSIPSLSPSRPCRL